MVGKDVKSSNHRWSKHIFPFDSHTELIKRSDAKEGWRLLQGKILLDLLPQATKDFEHRVTGSKICVSVLVSGAKE